MNDDFDDRARRWLQDQAEPDPAALRAVVARIDTLPARRRDRLAGHWLAVAAVFVVLLASLPTILGGNAGPRLRITPGASLTPPDPAAFAGDPRLALCGEGPDKAMAIFEMAHLADYPRHFPNAYPLQGLAGSSKGVAADLNAPALVVIGGSREGGGRLPDTGSPEATLEPGHYNLCVVVGAGRASWAPIAIVDVDTTGFVVFLPDGSSPPTPPDPAAFAGDPRLKACSEGAFPVEFVFEMRHARDYQTHFPAMSLAPELDVDAKAFAVVFAAGAGPFPITRAAPNPSASPEPTVSPTPETSRSVCILVNGTPNLYTGVDIAGMTVTLPGEASAPASPASAAPPTPRSPVPASTEFAPAAGVTGAMSTVWLDGNDRRVTTTVLSQIVGPGHCGWESTIWLRLDGSLFIRDPRGVLRAGTVGAYEAHATLPRTARSTGYHDAGRTIWRVSTDSDSIYIVSTGGVERWPRATDPMMGCA